MDKILSCPTSGKSLTKNNASLNSSNVNCSGGTHDTALVEALCQFWHTSTSHVNQPLPVDHPHRTGIVNTVTHDQGVDTNFHWHQRTVSDRCLSELELDRRTSSQAIKAFQPITLTQERETNKPFVQQSSSNHHNRPTQVSHSSVWRLPAAQWSNRYQSSETVDNVEQSLVGGMTEEQDYHHHLPRTIEPSHPFSMPLSFPAAPHFVARCFNKSGTNRDSCRGLLLTRSPKVLNNAIVTIKVIFRPTPPIGA